MSQQQHTNDQITDLPNIGPQFAKVFQTERGQIVAMLHQDSEQNPAILFWFDAGIDGLALTQLALGFTDDEEGEAKARRAFDKLDPAGVEGVVFRQIDNLRERFGGTSHDESWTPDYGSGEPEGVGA